ncbi:MAG: PolC-type DNA polymerase III [Ilumatobacteraceae bacterium]
MTTSTPGPVSAARFAVVDVETSGLSLRRDHVLQVGVVVVDGDGMVLDRWSSLLRPRRRWWFRVGPTHLHGIHRRQLRHAPPADQVLHQLADRLTDTRFVAHNAPFDIGFLRKAAETHGVPLPIHDPLCTLRMSRALDPERAQSHRLGDVCDRYGVVLVRPHDALADADATAAVLPHLLRAHGVTTVDQLASLPSAS